MVSNNYTKLKTNLRLSIQRLKLLGKKKNELAQKSRREIGAFLANDKIEKAQIRVEQIIREDYLVEALEIVEMYCDLLLARFGIIEQIKTLDDSLAEAVTSIIWVANRLDGCQELKVVADILSHKYGKEYAQAARSNSFNKVNEKLIYKMSIETPPKLLVEQYLIEIAKTLNIPYHVEVMNEHENKKEEKEDKDFIDFEEETLPSFPSVPLNANTSKVIHPIGFKVMPSVPPSAPSTSVNPHSNKHFSNNNPVSKNVSSKFTVKPLKPGFIDIVQDLPDVPKNMPKFDSSKDPTNKDEPFDFDDLSKRFEALKMRK